MSDPTFPIPDVGVYVAGAPEGPRALVRWRSLLSAYADLDDCIDPNREAYLSHFVFGPEMTAHYRANGRSVAGYAGPCWARWLVFDLDRADLTDALADARKLVAVMLQRYPSLDGGLPVYFSGCKGFHVYLDLAHDPPPAVGFHAVCRTLAEGLAGAAGVRIDTSIYDANRILRLPNSRHPKTGLYKRRIEADALFTLDVGAVRELARHPAGDGIPTVGDRVPELAADWEAAVKATADRAQARAAVRRDVAAGSMAAPRYLIDFLRFGVEEGERRPTLFRCAAWMTEAGCPAAAVHALLAEPARDLGICPKDVHRQIECGITHARRQAGPGGEGGPPA